MATRIIQRDCRRCGGIADVKTTEHFDMGGDVVLTSEDTIKCRNGCLGNGV